MLLLRLWWHTRGDFNLAKMVDSCMSIYVQNELIHLFMQHRTFPPLPTFSGASSQLHLVLQMLQTKFDRSLIPKSPQSTNNSNSLITQPTLIPPLLPRMDITNMHLHKRNVHRKQRISQRNTIVCESSGVYDNCVNALCSCGLDTVDEGAFVVRLEEGERGASGDGLGHCARLNVGEGFAAIDLGFSCPQEVEIGAIEEEDVFGRHVATFY